MSHDLFGWNQLTRRELMRLLGVSAGLIYLAPLAGCDHLRERQPVIPVDDWHKGMCRFCGTGCGVMIGLKETSPFTTP